MNYRFHLICNNRGSVRTKKDKPDLAFDEIAIEVKLSLPDALFKKPQLSAEITIPESAACAEPIPADVQENVKEAIQQATGMQVRLELVQQTTEEGK